MAGKRTTGTYNIGEPPDGSDPKVVFAYNLSRRMIKLGIPGQSELARRCDALLPKPFKGQKQRLTFGRDLISRYIRGLTMPRDDILPLLAEALECNPSDLVPPGSVSYAGKPPKFHITHLADDRVFVRVNCELDLAAATAMAKTFRAARKRLRSAK